MLDFTAILTQAQTEPSYVPPVSARELGIKLFEADKPIESCLTPEMRKGWLWALRASSWATGSEYMVSQGQEVSL